MPGDRREGSALDGRSLPRIGPPDTARNLPPGVPNGVGAGLMTPLPTPVAPSFRRVTRPRARTYTHTRFRLAEVCGSRAGERGIGPAAIHAHTISAQACK
jgi:hypothetical protein